MRPEPDEQDNHHNDEYPHQRVTIQWRLARIHGYASLSCLSDSFGSMSLTQLIKFSVCLPGRPILLRVDLCFACLAYFLNFTTELIKVVDCFFALINSVVKLRKYARQAK